MSIDRLGLGLAKMVLPTLLLNAVTWCVSFTILTTMVKEYICKIANICTVKISVSMVEARGGGYIYYPKSAFGKSHVYCEIKGNLKASETTVFYCC